MQTAAHNLRPNVVQKIAYETIDIGYGVESDIVIGYWTGDIFLGGRSPRYTIRPVDGSPKLYLFDDEIIDVTDDIDGPDDIIDD